VHRTVVNPLRFLGNSGCVGPVSAHRCERMDIVLIPWVPWVIHAFAHSCVKAVKHKKLLFHVELSCVRKAHEPQGPKEPLLNPWYLSCPIAHKGVAQLCFSCSNDLTPTQRTKGNKMIRKLKTAVIVGAYVGMVVSFAGFVGTVVMIMAHVG
jgi:hypothetical protein